MGIWKPNKQRAFVCIVKGYTLINKYRFCVFHGCVWMWPFVSLLLQFCCSAHYVIPPAALSLSLSVFLSSHFTPIFLSAACSTQTELKRWSHESDTRVHAPPSSLCQSQGEQKRRFFKYKAKHSTVRAAKHVRNSCPRPSLLQSKGDL